jgi:nitrite reductase/ring-hydroxylating ferredoxin subunit
MSLGPDLPRNWYLLGPSKVLPRGHILSQSIGGRSIVIYRGQDDGRPVAFTAQCAHMGCHLGKGAVVGNSLRCGLHHRLINADGRFERDRNGDLQQETFLVEDFMGGLFVHLGDKAAARPLVELGLQETASCYAGEHAFPLTWQSLVANGLDIDHLSAVHDRTLLGEPLIDWPHPDEFRLRYVTRPSARKVPDRVINWLAPDGIHGSIRSISGTMMLVESRVGSRDTFILMSFCPDDAGGTLIRGLVGIKGSASLTNRISARVARALFKAFLHKDLHVLEGLRWHEPAFEHSFGDRAMRDVASFFRGLPRA